MNLRLINILEKNKEKRIKEREIELESEDRPYKNIEEPELGLEFLPFDTVHYNDDVWPDLSILVDKSDDFFLPKKVKHYNVSEQELTFLSEVETRTKKNNTVYAEHYPCSIKRNAVVLLPNWNANYSTYRKIAKLFSFFGISVLLLHLPYHEKRRPSEWKIAKDMVSPNIGMTIQSIQQSVLDVQDSVTWLKSQQYESIGVVGVSIGSAIATLAASHDARINSLVQILMASNFAEAVWSGIATTHIRKSFDNWIELDQLKKLWAFISPDTYVERLYSKKKVLMITGKYDPVFRPYLAQEMATLYDQNNVSYRWDVMRCGHYSLGDFPYSIISINKTITWLRSVL